MVCPCRVGASEIPATRRQNRRQREWSGIGEEERRSVAGCKLYRSRRRLLKGTLSNWISVTLLDNWPPESESLEGVAIKSRCGAANQLALAALQHGLHG